eukprot:Hpha_TRINITY_DN11489_c0_g1::TRINITY_DN11489_c0_g1_i2::g.137461::m.137461
MDGPNIRTDPKPWPQCPSRETLLRMCAQDQSSEGQALEFSSYVRPGPSAGNTEWMYALANVPAAAFADENARRAKALKGKADSCLFVPYERPLDVEGEDYEY